MTEKDISVIKYQLEIAAAALETAFLLLDGNVVAEENTECFHPEDQRQDYSTSGTNRYLCKACGAIIEQPFGKEDEDVICP